MKTKEELFPATENLRYRFGLHTESFSGEPIYLTDKEIIDVPEEDLELFAAYFKDSPVHLGNLFAYKKIGVGKSKGEEWFTIPQTGFCCIVKKTEIYGPIC